ncbi:MAG: hypothetical protein ACTSQE_12395 [Candidatus Heimdallarchaeaceae archaeon]
MKITYEFDSEIEDDMDRRKLYEIADDMFGALCDLRSYMRELYKGYKEDGVDEIMDTINQLIEESEIYKIE